MKTRGSCNGLTSFYAVKRLRICKKPSRLHTNELETRKESLSLSRSFRNLFATLIPAESFLKRKKKKKKRKRCEHHPEDLNEHILLVRLVMGNEFSIGGFILWHKFSEQLRARPKMKLSNRTERQFSALQIYLYLRTRKEDYIGCPCIKIHSCTPSLEYSKLIYSKTEPRKEKVLFFILDLFFSRRIILLFACKREKRDITISRR